jgi:hypothetical protein
MSIVLLGSTSGSCTLQEQAVAGTTTLTLPTFNGTVGLLVSGTAVTCAGQTSIDFTSIPAGVRRITVMFNGVSTSGTSRVQIQLGDAGGIETSGYLGAVGSASADQAIFTSGFLVLATVVAAGTANGIVTLCLQSSNTWAMNGILGRAETVGTTSVSSSGGIKSLSDTLTQIRITTVNGTDTFDTTPSAGSINILYE